MNMSQDNRIYRVRSNNMYKLARGDCLRENKDKMWNNCPFEVYFSRKSSLEMYQIYWNVANSGLNSTK